MFQSILVYKIDLLTKRNNTKKSKSEFKYLLKLQCKKLFFVFVVFFWVNIKEPFENFHIYLKKNKKKQIVILISFHKTFIFFYQQTRRNKLVNSQGKFVGTYLEMIQIYSSFLI